MESLGHECAWQVEIHPYRQKILQRHWPDVTRYEDVRTIDGNVEPVDMVVGGFPCQPFSVAGKQRGADDERNLWPETIRVIRELRPRYAFLENVPGLLSHEYFGTVLGELAEAGYDAQWGCFTAAQVGASHKRERLFILAYARHDGGEGRFSDPSSSLRESCGEPSPQSGVLAHTRQEHERLQRRGVRPESTGSSFPPGPNDLDAWARVLAEVPSLEPAVCRVATGVRDRTHRLAALGDAVVPAQAAMAFRELKERIT